jgi:hypothetical protein
MPERTIAILGSHGISITGFRSDYSNTGSVIRRNNIPMLYLSAGKDAGCNSGIQNAAQSIRQSGAPLTTACTPTSCTG